MDPDVDDVSDVDAPSLYKYDAKPGQFPWVVTFKTVEHCMGTLVDPLWVLTAAHCLEQSSDPSYYLLQLGYVSSKNIDNDGPVETALQLHPYPRYRNSKTARVRDHGNDIALVKMKQPFNRAPTLQTRQIPYVSDTHRRRPCYVLGFVQEVSNPREEYRMLQFARAYGRTFDDCHRKSRGGGDAELTMRHTLCATGTGPQVEHACSGNPGGPLVCPVRDVKWKDSTQLELVGVSSWNEPGVYCGAMSRYADVGYFADWLMATIHGDSFVKPDKEEKDLQQQKRDKVQCAGATAGKKNYTPFFHFVGLVLFYIL